MQIMLLFADVKSPVAGYNINVTFLRLRYINGQKY